ncbi:MAG: helix-turn-helix transcriptional regulator [Anaerotignum sp.]|nr:helix-turn-helix transcriptional regulator [Anaerotignum sp.]
MPISMGEKIKIVLKRRNMTTTELAEKIGTSRQNLTNKFKRNNFSEKEIAEIAAVLDCTFEGNLILKDTGEVI